MYDISGEAWDDFDDIGNLRVVTLSLDKLYMKIVLFTYDTQGQREIDTTPIS